jgi:phage-related tail fiber protein
VAQITNSVDTGVLGSTLDLAVAYLNQHRLYPGWIVFSATENIFSLTLECDGSAVSRTTYARLFAAIGTRYGAGDGVTTFNLPDYRGRNSARVGSWPWRRPGPVDAHQSRRWYDGRCGRQ